MHDTDEHYSDERQSHDTRMEYVQKTGRHVTLIGIIYKLSRIAHAIQLDWKNYNLDTICNMQPDITLPS